MNKTKEVVHVKRFDMCSLFATARVMVNESCLYLWSRYNHFFAGGAVKRAVEENFPAVQVGIQRILKIFKFGVGVKIGTLMTAYCSGPAGESH